MWIRRKELEELRARIDSMYSKAVADWEEAVRKGLMANSTVESTREQLGKLLCSHRDLCHGLARLSGKLEAMATRW
jgi:hypothetical protein